MWKYEGRKFYGLLGNLPSIKSNLPLKYTFDDR